MENSKAIVRALSKLSFHRPRTFVLIPPPHTKHCIESDGDESLMNADSEARKRTRFATRPAKMSTTMSVRVRHRSSGYQDERHLFDK